MNDKKIFKDNKYHDKNRKYLGKSFQKDIKTDLNSNNNSKDVFKSNQISIEKQFNYDIKDKKSIIKKSLDKGNSFFDNQNFLLIKKNEINETKIDIQQQINLDK